MHVGAAKMLPGSLTKNVDSHRQWFLSFFLGNVDCAELALSVNVSMISVRVSRGSRRTGRIPVNVTWHHCGAKSENLCIYSSASLEGKVRSGAGQKGDNYFGVPIRPTNNAGSAPHRMWSPSMTIRFLSAQVGRVDDQCILRRPAPCCIRSGVAAIRGATCCDHETVSLDSLLRSFYLTCMGPQNISKW